MCSWRIGRVDARIRAVLVVYIFVLGVSHFVLTPTIYLQSSNLRYFNGSWRNRIVYFAIPVVSSSTFTPHSRSLRCIRWWQWAAGQGRQMPSSTLVLFALFDGLFVFHYFVESFIWRFSGPYYRQRLGPLYFGSRPATAPGPVRAA